MKTRDAIAIRTVAIAALYGLMLFAGTTLAPASAAAPVANSPPPPAQKAAAQPASTDDPAKVAAARDFLRLYQPNTDPKYVSDMLDKTMAQAIEAAKQDDPKLDPKKFAAERRATVMAKTNRRLEVVSHVVSRFFSVQELKALAAFYGSPLGRKLTSNVPKVQGELMREARLRQPLRGMGMTKMQVQPNGAPKPAPQTHK